MPVGEQIAVLFCGTHALMADIPLEKVSEFEGLFLDRMRASHADVLDTLATGKIDSDVEAVLTKVAAEVVSQINA
jgi:F-type H+-transporting ATPase subunit alpha